MVLRRLFSGWLIAMAALARSVAQALERASEDRSVPAPDPVMAALAERYPGAPAHWLAHLAERTSQLAQAGEVPLSLNSDPATWPPPRPEASPSPVEAMERVAVPRDPPSARPAPRYEATVPTLAALRERPSEVWRRPEVTSKRRSRPVFASSTSASAPGPATLAPSAPSAGALARRPRSPLSVKADTPSSARPRVIPPSEAEGRPESTEPEAPWPGVATPDVVELRSLRRPSTEGAPPDRAPAQKGPACEPELRSDGIEAATVARGRKSWLVEALIEKPARVVRSLAPRIGPPRRARPAGGAWAAANRAGAVELAPSALAGGETGGVRRPGASRSADAPIQPAPAARGAIFRALAGLGARSERGPAAGPAIAERAPSGDRTSGDAPPRALASSPAPRKGTFSTHAPSVVSRSGLDWNPAPAATRPPEPLAWGQERGASTLGRTVYAPDDEARAHARRPTFTAPGAVPSRTAAHPFAGAATDDRWPALPPATFASPQGAEAPLPRWDELAREQEEGRWSV
jgi:hypothetical protein